MSVIISDTKPCCPANGDFRWHPLRKELWLFDGSWHTILQDIAMPEIDLKKLLGQASLIPSAFVQTSSDSYSRYPIAGGVKKYDKGLVTSGEVADALESLSSSLNNSISKINDIWKDAVRKGSIVSNIAWVGSADEIPNTKAIVDYFVSNPYIWEWAIQVLNKAISVKSATNQNEWVIKISTFNDYDSMSPNTAISPNLIKPIIEDIDKHIERLRDRCLTLENANADLLKKYEGVLNRITELENKVKVLESKHTG